MKDNNNTKVDLKNGSPAFAKPVLPAVVGSQRKYQIIYADPAWSYYNDSTAKQDCTTVKGMRRPPYSVMSSNEIMNLPIKEIAADNSILFIWTTDYHLARCVEVIKAWGFEYKTVGFVWAKKNKKGLPVCFMGAYTMKSGTELCLLATRGKDAHKLVRKHNVRSLIESPREHHSKKPDEVRTRIVELLGDLPRVELFARENHDGWDAWGNEVKESINLETSANNGR
jgi:N6-adenosine-specific RNA methylase IME4